MKKLLMLCILIVLIIFMFISLDFRDIEDDEFCTLTVIRISQHQSFLNHVMKSTINPPVYFALETFFAGKALSTVKNEFIRYRILSLIFFILTLVIVFLILKKLKLPGYFIFLFAFNSYLHQFAGIARSYSLLIFLEMCLIYYLIDFLATPDIKNYLKLTLVFIIICYTHYLGGVINLPIMLYTCIYFIKNNSMKKNIKFLIIISVLTIICSIPLLIIIKSQFAIVKREVYTITFYLKMRSIITRYLRLVCGNFLNSRLNIFKLLFTFVFFSGFAYFYFSNSRLRDNGNKIYNILIVNFFIGVLSISVLYWFKLIPFTINYAGILIPYFIFSIILILKNIKQENQKILCTVLIIIFLGCNLISVFNFYFDKNFYPPAHRKIRNFLKKNLKDYEYIHIFYKSKEVFYYYGIDENIVLDSISDALNSEKRIERVYVLIPEDKAFGRNFIINTLDRKFILKKIYEFPKCDILEFKNKKV